jgi:hypothetical protein
MTQANTDDGEQEDYRHTDAERIRSVIRGDAREIIDVTEITVGLDSAYKYIVVTLQSDCDACNIWKLSEYKGQIATKIIESDAEVTLRDTCDGEAKLLFTVK